MIDTLILSGGAHHGGMRSLGAVKKLLDKEIILMKNIKNIYAISAGAIIACAFSTLVDKNEIIKYIINRPWGNLVEMTPDMMLCVFTNKGIFNKHIITEIMKPLLASKDLSYDITLKEFYEYNNILIKIYTFDLNENRIVELSHITYPDYKLIDCIYYSTSIPVMFEPSVINNKCYVDPGCFINYPLEYALADKIDENNMIGIRCIFKPDNDTSYITDNANLLEFTLFLFKRVIIDRTCYKKIKNEIEIEMETFNMITMLDAFKYKKNREDYLNEGAKIGEEFINSYHRSHLS